MSIEDVIAKAVKDAIQEPLEKHVNDLFSDDRIDNIIGSAIKDAILQNIKSWRDDPQDVLRDAIIEALKEREKGLTKP